jgi:hypothetical protein
MANIKYFADTAAGTLSFGRVDYRGKEGKFGYDAASKSWIKVTRSVEYKSSPSRHECDARCINATGLIMKCECKCGGKNHGKGAFNCSEAA